MRALVGAVLDALVRERDARRHFRDDHLAKVQRVVNLLGRPARRAIRVHPAKHRVDPHAENRSTRAERIVLAVAQFVACAAVLFLVATAHAEDDMGVWLSREDAARLFSTAAEAPRLADKIAALEAEAAALRRIAEAQARIIELADKVAEAEQRLRALAESERDLYRDKADRLASEKDKGSRWLRAQAWGATGALVGSFAMPGIGTAAGAIVGGLAGFLAP